MHDKIVRLICTDGMCSRSEEGKQAEIFVRLLL